MDNEQALSNARKALEGSDLLEVVEITQINFKPHPFVIGAALVGYVADNYGGMLNKRAIEAFHSKHGWSCDQKSFGRHCTLSYDQHTSETALVLRLRRSTTRQEIGPLLYQVKLAIQGSKVDGFAIDQGNGKLKFEIV